jgi:hypothetical protein
MFWQRLDLPGSEYCTFVKSDDGWLFESTVLLALGTTPIRVQYRIACDAAWRTRTVEIACVEGLEARAMQIAVDARQQWWVEGVERVDLRGCLDTDLGVTPATNTLPIRRLRLAIGASEEIAAAWVRFPEMTITRAMQRYTRVGAQSARARKSPPRGCDSPR